MPLRKGIYRLIIEIAEKSTYIGNNHPRQQRAVGNFWAQFGPLSTFYH